MASFPNGSGHGRSRHQQELEEGSRVAQAPVSPYATRQMGHRFERPAFQASAAALTCFRLLDALSHPLDFASGQIVQMTYRWLSFLNAFVNQ